MPLRQSVWFSDDDRKLLNAAVEAGESENVSQAVRKAVRTTYKKYEKKGAK